VESAVAKAKALAVFTIVYNILEALVATAFGAHDRTLSLFGFGLDSLLEAAAGAVVYWHLMGSDGKREELAEKAIGALLMALAGGLVLGAAMEAWQGRSPEGGEASIAIAILSLAVMGWLYRAKLQAARAIDSRALLLDAFCTKSCMWLSGLLLLGAAVFKLTGWRYFDPIVTVAMAWLIWREGREAWDEDEHCDCEEPHHA
jgi:divalent metal cation (Fe/Co/Zn/Cd) transporter